MHALLLALLTITDAPATPTLVPQVGGPQADFLFSNDDRFLYSADGGVFEADTGRLLRFQPIEPGAVALSQDERLLLLCGTRYSELRDRLTGKKVGSLQRGADTRHTCRSATFTDGDRTVMTVGFGHVEFHETQGLRFKSDWAIPADHKPSAIALLPSGAHAIATLTGQKVGAAPRTLLVRSPLDNYKAELSIELPGVGWDQLSVASDGKRAVAASLQATAVIDLENGKVVRLLQNEAGGVMHPDGKTVATIRHPSIRDYQVVLHDVESGTELSRYVAPGPLLRLRFDHRGNRLGALYYPDQARLDLLDARSLSLIRAVGHAQQSARGLAFSHDGRSLAVAHGGDDNIRIWNLHQARLDTIIRVGQLIGTKQAQSLTHLDYSADDKSIVVRRDDEILVVRLAPLSIQHRVKGRTRGYRGFAVDPVGPRFATSSAKGVIEIRDLNTGLVLGSIKPEFDDDPVFAPRHHLILVPHGSRDNSLIVERFDDRTFERLQPWAWKGNYALAPGPSARLSGDGNTLVLPGVLVDHVVDIKSGKKTDVGTPLDSESPKNAIAVNNSGSQVIDVTRDGLGFARTLASPNASGTKRKLIAVEPSDLVMSPTNNDIVAVAGGHVNVWNMAKQTSWMLLAAGDEWGVFAPDGTFDASPGGTSLVAMVAGDEVYGVDQLAVTKNRPDLLLAGIEVGDPQTRAYLLRVAQRRAKKLAGAAAANDETLPTAKVTKVDVTEGRARLIGVCAAPAEHALRYQVYMNGVPLFVAPKKADVGVTFEQEVALQSGVNRIELSCLTAQGNESLRALEVVTSKAASKPELYFLGFGVSDYKKPELRLRYAAKDAKDLEDTFKSMRGDFAKVHTKVLLDKAVSAASLKAAKTFIDKATEQDVVVLFIAGHGMHDDGDVATYYYLAANSDPNALAKSAVAFEQIEDLLQGIKPRRKLFLMDTCESGEVDEAVAAANPASPMRARNARGVKKKSGGSAVAHDVLLNRERFIFNDLSRRSGAVVFSSSRGGELSYEMETLKNGVFSAAILTALRTAAADSNKDGKVSIDELRLYVTESVAAQTAEQQHPVVDRDNIYSRFDLPLSLSGR